MSNRKTSYQYLNTRVMLYVNAIVAKANKFTFESSNIILENEKSLQLLVKRKTVFVSHFKGWIQLRAILSKRKLV